MPTPSDTAVGAGPGDQRQSDGAKCRCMLLGECLHGSSSWVPTPTASRSGLFGCDRSRTQNSLNFPNISNHVCQVKSSQAGHAAGMSRIGAVARTKGPLFSGCRQPARLVSTGVRADRRGPGQKERKVRRREHAQLALSISILVAAAKDKDEARWTWPISTRRYGSRRINPTRPCTHPASPPTIFSTKIGSRGSEQQEVTKVCRWLRRVSHRTHRQKLCRSQPRHKNRRLCQKCHLQHELREYAAGQVPQRLPPPLHPPC